MTKQNFQILQIVAMIALVAYVLPKANTWKKEQEQERRPILTKGPTPAVLVSVDSYSCRVKIPKIPEGLNLQFIKGNSVEAEFVRQLAKMAVKESARLDWQVPPSLIVAQAILESNYGKSRLAKKANNFFGHKWRGKGKYLLANDDAPNEKFTKYASRWASVRAHTELLMGQLYKGRLKGSPTLENWLDALCGNSNSVESKKFVKRGGMVYATACYNSCYSCKVRTLVESWQLHKLDEAVPQVLAAK
jgi:flagellum-specific peptidoglycan hydrolase FlgJ